MAIERHSDLALVCDVGGTNTSLAIASRRQDGSIELLHRCRHNTQEITDLESVLQDYFDDSGMPPRRSICRAVISAAGPVRDNCCRLSNANWDIDGNRLGQHIGFRCSVINDYCAICYGVIVFEHSYTERLLPIISARRAKSDAIARSNDEKDGLATKIVIGAGTGLGVGFLLSAGDEIVAIPSEGGHIGFAPIDEETAWLHEIARAKTGLPPRAEEFISGQGLVAIFDALHSRGPSNGNAEWIANQPVAERAALIAQSAMNNRDDLCVKTMRIFSKCYGKFCGDMAILLNAQGGIYLGGGIAPKNRRWFTDEPFFREAFFANSMPTAQAVLRDVSVSMIVDYDISLYGDASHAFRLDRRSDIA